MKFKSLQIKNWKELHIKSFNSLCKLHQKAQNIRDKLEATNVIKKVVKICLMITGMVKLLSKFEL